MDIPVLGKKIRGITYQVNKYLEKKTAPLGIRHGQFEYFLIIATNPGINQNEIARMKNVGKASVTKAIKILEKEGCILRKINASDKRNYQLYCTEKGNEIIKDLLSYGREIEEKLCRNISEEEMDIFLKVLDKIYLNSQTL